MGQKEVKKEKQICVCSLSIIAWTIRDHFHLLHELNWSRSIYLVRTFFEQRIYTSGSFLWKWARVMLTRKSFSQTWKANATFGAPFYMKRNLLFIIRANEFDENIPVFCEFLKIESRCCCCMKNASTAKSLTRQLVTLCWTLNHESRTDAFCIRKKKSRILMAGDVEV